MIVPASTCDFVDALLPPQTSPLLQYGVGYETNLEPCGKLPFPLPLLESGRLIGLLDVFAGETSPGDGLIGPNVAPMLRVGLIAACSTVRTFEPFFDQPGDGLFLIVEIPVEEFGMFDPPFGTVFDF